MSRVTAFALVLCSFALVAVSSNHAQPQPYFGAPQSGPGAAVNGLPTGAWRVQFANDVIETCEIRRDGTATVTEPGRTSPGKTVTQSGRVVVLYDDDRIERWTPVGKRLVVEHWASSAQWPTNAPVLGIADRIE
ncbi:MAG: hypothetical protein JWP89_4590 [Schlesneria sp.]|nr:hypothetical protein [Schlesneria sp.]